MITQTFDKWFDNLSIEDQQKVFSHVLEKKISGVVMEGLFSGPHGKTDKGMFSGPAGMSGTKVCGSCGRPM